MTKLHPMLMIPIYDVDCDAPNDHNAPNDLDQLICLMCPCTHYW